MKQHQLSAKKRFVKPFLFGTLFVGLATVFFNRRWFFGGVEEPSAEERAQLNTKRLEVLERRQRLLEEVAEKKRGGGS